MAPALTPQQRRRYARQMILPGIGEAGQLRLLAAHVAVVGAGGLGSPALAYLAGAGVGRLTVIDSDRVEASNLPRQILFETGDDGLFKADCTADRLRGMNPDVRTTTHHTRLDAGNVEALLAGAAIILDGSDNFATRLIVADYAAHAGIPLVSGAVVGDSGQLAVYMPYLGAPYPCYRCLVGNAPQDSTNCATNGVYGPAAGLIGSLMAQEALKILLDHGTVSAGKFLHYEALTAGFITRDHPRNRHCSFCGQLNAAPQSALKS